METKTLSIQELKDGYTDRHGFVFIGNAPSSINSCDRVSAALIKAQYTESQVEFVVQLNPNTYIYVYPEGVSFNMPKFLENSNRGSFMFGGVWQIIALQVFLKTN